MDKLNRYEFQDIYMMAYDLFEYDRTYKTCGMIHISAFDLKYYKTKTFEHVYIKPLLEFLGSTDSTEKDSTKYYEEQGRKYMEHCEYVNTYKMFVCSKWDKQNNNESFDFNVCSSTYFSLKHCRSITYNHYKILGITGEGFQTLLHIVFME